MRAFYLVVEMAVKWAELWAFSKVLKWVAN
jgi:hypothetical protein